ncbi:MAG TPA: FHA domain-containing protein [Blastocatellia bacterium]|nr:FHA domain-containing protein [Blastocatellia bacterium]
MSQTSNPLTPEEQLREWVRQMAPEHRAALLQILSEDERLQREARVNFAERQLRRMCSLRGEDWEAMPGSERERFAEQLIAEGESYITQPGPGAEARITCYQCGREMSPRDLFRIYFGHRRPSAEQASAKLVVLDLDGTSAQFPILAEGETVIGRMDPIRGISPEVDLTRFDPGARVSRRHARITLRGDQFCLEDLGSSNGTVINGRVRLKKGESQPLADGDEILLGGTLLRFHG